MIARAASKLPTWNQRIEEFKMWLLINIDNL
jgi:hypothetical protein